MGFALRPGISFCEVGDQLLFLDVPADRYFCLGESAEREFQLLLKTGGPAAADGAVARMLKTGLLVEADGASLPTPSRAPQAPSSSLLDRPLPAAGTWLRLGVLRGLVVARLAVRLQPLERVLEQLVLRKARTRLRQADQADVMQEVAAAFDWTRTMMRSHDQCLPRSLAAAHRLAALGVEADFIMGVSLNPFAAHSWVQCGPCLVNDRLDAVRHFTPILCI